VVSGPRQLFRQEAALLATAGHNVHENVGSIQEGGTTMLVIDEITQFRQSGDRDGDPTGLGHWVSMAFWGQGGLTTRVVTGYNPCLNKLKESGTTYQQHRRFFIRHQHDTICLQTRFQRDFISQLKEWRDAGEQLVVCIDANQHIYHGRLGKELTDQEGLNLVEPVHATTGVHIGPTFFRGSKPIDGVWVSKDLHVTNAAVLPVGHGVGDHRMFVLDITNDTFVGDCNPAIQRLQH